MCLVLLVQGRGGGEKSVAGARIDTHIECFPIYVLISLSSLMRRCIFVTMAKFKLFVCLSKCVCLCWYVSQRERERVSVGMFINNIA